MNDETMVPITEDEFIHGPLGRRKRVNLKWYAIRWAVGFVRLLCGMVCVVTLGFWWPRWDLEFEAYFLA